MNNKISLLSIFVMIEPKAIQASAHSYRQFSQSKNRTEGVMKSSSRFVISEVLYSVLAYHSPIWELIYTGKCGIFI